MHLFRWTAAVVALAAAPLVGCTDSADSSGREVHRIEIEHVGSLVDDEGPGGSYGGVANLTLLEDGRFLFWDHYHPARIRIYDSDLQLDSVFGRAGPGPGEFGRPRFQGVIGDTLFVFQEDSGRLELFLKDDLVHLVTRLGGIGGAEALEFSPDGYIVASSLGMSPGGTALPLREMSTSGEVRESFGAAFPVVAGRTVPFHSRNLDFAPDGSLWVVPVFEARLERWIRSGAPAPHWNLDTTFVFGDIEMARPMDYVGNATPAEAPSPRIRGVSHHADGPVWILLAVPHPDWANRVRTAETQVDLSVAPETTQRITQILAVDPESGEILATRDVDELWFGFAGQGVAYSWDTDPYGVPYLDLWRPRLVSESEAP